MPVHTPFTQSFDQLPASLAIFPLANAVVFPGSQLPLNIFEPRYLNMVQDAMRDSQLIGMIQPSSNHARQTQLQKVGCAGRITRYEETLDGRFHIVLKGVCRFEVKEELDSIRGYRMVVPDWQIFHDDFETPVEPDELTLNNFKSIYRQQLTSRKISFDSKAMDQMSAETLINSAAYYLPISSDDKQLLLEAMSLRDKAAIILSAIHSEETSDRTKH